MERVGAFAFKCVHETEGSSLKPGRKSAAELAIVPAVSVERVPRLQPPPGLSAGEVALFRRVVAECSADHFVASDSPLLVSYCQAVLLTRHAFKRIGEDAYSFQLWQQSARTLATLATKLRLCPHSRSDPKTVGRRSRGGIGLSAIDYLEMVSGDDSD
jgi:hypothetical protein